MKCPRCGGGNFDWAPKCDHCGVPLRDDPDRDVAAAHPPVEPIAYAETDAEQEARERVEFQLALAALTPRVFITPALLAANIGLFLVMVVKGVPIMTPAADALIRWGANYGPLTTHGQWWRLVSAAFVHVGLWHLAMNMVVLWRLGPFVERLFGNVAFLVLYMVSALLGDVVSLAVHPLTVAAGASGALFGLYGGLLAFLVLQRRSIPKSTLSSLFIGAGAFLALNIVNAGLSAVTNSLASVARASAIDFSAHAGGFAGGVLAGCVLALPLAPPNPKARLARTVMAAFAGVLVAAASAFRISVVDDAAAAVRDLVVIERDSLSLYSTSLAKVQTAQMTRAQFGDMVERQLLPRWTVEQQHLTALRIPEPQRAAVTKLVQYMSLRADEWRFMGEGIRANDEAIVAKSHAKAEEISVLLRAPMPNPRVSELARRSTSRDDPFATEIRKVIGGEHARATLYDDTLRRLRAGQLTADQCAGIIEQRLLQPWNDERSTLSKVPISELEQNAAGRWLTYMSLRADSWQLIADGLRKNDVAMVQQGVQKGEAAAAMMELGSYK